MPQRQIILDNCFHNGFAVKPQTDGNNDIIGYLTLNDSDYGKPSNVLAQWYCGYWRKDDKSEYDRHNILNGYKQVEGDFFEWGDASKKLRLNYANGSLEMALDASKEYKSARKAGEPWPHILIEYQTESCFLSKIKKITLDLDFVLRKLQCEMNSVDGRLHAAQLVWYAIIRNCNRAKKDYGKYIWFGCNLFDTRYRQTPFMAFMDGGKEINTGTLIYQPASGEYQKERAELNKRQRIHYDFTQHLKNAFSIACEQGILQDSDFSDMAITGGNFGWEIPGTYNVSVEIDKVELNVTM